MTGHAFLAPSSAFRWGPGRCAASAALEAQYPEDEESVEAREGTAAHHFLSEALAGNILPVGAIAPNGVAIDMDMIACADDMIRDVRDTYRACTPGSVFKIESRVFAHCSINPKNDGTPDAYILDRAGRRLHCWDYKYGHRYVDAYRNFQGINYVIAILETEGVPIEEWEIWTITITIAQPRNYHPDGPLREWYFNGAELVTWASEFRAAADQACGPNPAFTTGEHCRYCSGRHACPALERSAMSLVDLSMTAQPFELPPAALGLELRIIREAMKRLGARATGLEEQALAKFRAGQDIPHWRAEYSLGREKWREDAKVEEIKLLGEMYGVDALKPPAAITPTQLRKAGVDDEAVKAYSHKPRGGMTLVPFHNDDIARRFS